MLHVCNLVDESFDINTDDNHQVFDKLSLALHNFSRDQSALLSLYPHGDKMISSWSGLAEAFVLKEFSPGAEPSFMLKQFFFKATTFTLSLHLPNDVHLFRIIEECTW